MANQSLDVPAEAAGDPKAAEIARIWIVDGDQHVSLRVGGWAGPEGWGIILADLARHVANAFEQVDSMKYAGALTTIENAFLVEMMAPTTESSGEVIS